MIGRNGFSSWPGRLLPALLLVLLVGLAYFPGLGGGYAFDDYPNLVDNRALRVTEADWRAWLAAAFSSPSSELQRPLAMLSFAANHFWTGLDPWWMKATNVFLHALNALLVLALARRVLAVAVGEAGGAPRVEWLAWLVAAGWALHPLNLMAVLYVVQRMEVLSHLFVFAGLLLYFDGRARQLGGRPGAARILAGLVGGTALGAMAKESAVLLPLYAFGAELILFRFQGRRADGRPLRGTLLAMFGFVLLLPAIAALAWLLPLSLAPDAYASRDFTLGQRLLTEPRVLLDYLRWLLLPDLGQLGLHHDDYAPSRGPFSPWTTALALLFWPALAALAWWKRRQRPLFALGLLWFLSAHALTASFIPLELMFEHRNYFASLGVLLALADLACLTPTSARGRWLASALASAFVVVLLLLTHLRALEWSDPVRFAASEAAKHPQSARATYDLARLLVVLGDYRADSPHTIEAWPAIERARRAPRSGLMPEHAALMLAARTGRPLRDEWWDDMYRKARAEPLRAQDVAAIGALTRCAVDRNCDFPPQRMLALYEAALSRGANAEVLNIFGDYALNVLHEPELAIGAWRQAIRFSPAQAQYRINLAGVLGRLGRREEALAEIRALRRLGRLGQNAAAADALEAALPATAPPRQR